MTFIPASWRKLSSWLLLPGCLASFGFAHTPAPIVAAAPLITQAIDENALVRLTGTVHPLATPDADQGAVADSTQLGRTILMLKSSDTTQAALKKFMDDQQNSKSPNYHHWLKPEEFGQRFGAAPQDIQRITQWLESHGLQPEAPTLGRNLVIFSGTQAQFKNAFHTEIHHYLVQGEIYTANANDPQIPVALAPIVSGFSSLNNFPRRALHTKPQLMRHDGSSWKPAAAVSKVQPLFTTTQGTTYTYHVVVPYDLATIYNIKALWDAGIDGTGQTIAIVSNSDINPADIDYFRTTFGLPAKKLNVVYYGVNPGMNNDEDEADLDVQWAGAVAKNATIDLVVAADSSTSPGIDAAAEYIINNNLASILNVSYGGCEYLLGTAANQYYNQIWQQAAAQGITVVVAAGDSGSAVCDREVQYALYGLAVSGLASTPYNVAVGGTDFRSSYLAPNTYWNTTNDPTTFQSVKSYLPETTWNDSCASPDVLATLQSLGVTDATPEALCNDANETPFLTVAAGSGGQSNCAVVGVDPSIPCISGNPKPAWQSGVAGIPLDGVRDLPDVSLMAGIGLWSSFYVYCQSDALPSGTCDVNNAIQGAGGTSFASPIFAAILALVQQKTASQQGNVNYTLYKLAAAQYSGPGAAACTSSGAVAGNACMFYDITDGTIAVPCFNGSRNCTPSAGDAIGILPGFSAASGYDLATGLGSVNAYNLVEGWSGASTQFLPTTTTIAAAGAATATYGSGLKVSVSVGATAPASGMPSGDVGVTTNSTVPGAISAGETTLVNGQGVVPTGLLPVGTYQLFARYAGDASFAPSQSGGLSVTIGKANLSAALTATRTVISQGQKLTLSVAASGVPNGANPTGTVVVANATTGAVFGTLALAASYSSLSTPVSLAFVTVSSSDLEFGTDSIIATYSGDSNYNAAYVTALGVTLGGSFTTSISPAVLTLGPNASGSVTVTVTPNGTTVLNPSALSFSCPAALPAGFSCSFSAPTSGGNGTIISTLTLQLAAPLVTPPSTVTASRAIRGGRTQAGVLASLAGLMVLALPGRRRRFMHALTVLAFVPFFIVGGCGGGHGSNSAAAPPSMISTTTTLSASPAAPTLGSPVVLASKVAPESGTGVPTGSITFSDGSTSLGVVNLASGTASLTVNSLPAGAQTIVATYSGDSAFTGSASSASTVDVTFTTTITVTVADMAGDKSGAGLAVSVQ
ncbi:MAG TPA: Ig-like domain repeat protein [Steroidobacteraceae bacterium]|nr:Ig-like domain repeat protein [Steroidobacteraceae bacterium]